MTDPYHIDSADTIPSPQLIFFEDLIDQNIQEMIRVAGNADRLRPHCKTHKTREIATKLIECGISKHKCATIAEAEMLASAGAQDVFLAYNIVGPNLDRMVALTQQFESVDFKVTADHPIALTRLSEKMDNANLEIGVVMDLDTGLQRTGIRPEQDAVELYEMISSLPGVRPAGLHWYDGQHRQTDLFERTAAVEEGIAKLLKLRDQLTMSGFQVPHIIVGGTGSFPIHAQHQEPQLELSPGTVILHDAGYKSIYPDLDFVPAAAVLTRVISRPSSQRATLDLGSKAIAADPPAGNRCAFPQLTGAKEILQNEEHLVLEFEEDTKLVPGDSTIAFPWHVCPTSALYDSAWIVKDRQIVGTWEIAARNRKITF